jgi:hypothetical protein
MAYTQQTPIGTPDVNLITKTLAGLQPDSALQQYAALHKNNPYILSLAKSESDRRKALRTAVQGNPGQMPTVADREIAGMATPVMTQYGGPLQTGSGGRVQTELPEDQGIARIPTPNMRGMADGGIAGYEDDQEGMATGGMGGMFNFAQQSEPVVRMSGGGAVQKFAGKGEQLVRTTDGGKSWFLDVPAASRGNPAVASALANQKFASREEAIAAYDAVTGGGAAPAVPDRYKTPELILPYGQSKATNVLDNAPPPAPPPAPAAQQGLGSLPSAGKVISPEDAVKQAGKFVDYGPAEMEIAYARDRQTKQGEDLLRTFEESKPKTPAFEGLEKLLDKQEAETGGEKDKAAGLALVMAGLGIAGGSSQYALQNLKEAIPAVKEYGDALKDIKKMGRENMKMRADIEQARRAEDKDDTKTLLLLKERIAAREDKIDELGIGLLMKVADTNARTAGDIWKTSYEGVNRKETAGIAAQAHTMGQLNYLEKLGSASPESALRKGFDLTQMERQQPGILAAYEKMAGDTTITTGGKYATKGEEFKAKYPTPKAYLLAIGELGGGQGQLYSDNMVNPNAVRSR